MKKLLGKTEMEDALKKLDNLTQEEARMAAAENLKLTHTVDKKVEGVVDTLVAIDNRVAGVDDRVAGVDERVPASTTKWPESMNEWQLSMNEWPELMIESNNRPTS